MTVASAQTLRKIAADGYLLEPFHERTRLHGMTYGLGPAGYDIRIAEEFALVSGQFVLASSVERFKMPNNLLGIVHDKSSWARLGLQVQNTVIEPGWEGYLTLELTTAKRLDIPKGAPIAQVVFHLLDMHTLQPYEGKYQNQKAGPQPALFDGDTLDGRPGGQ